ncbi:hypothetical protein IMG5_063590 [Ichthyophthirius multifiliis]|uniref:Transmembrane protein n=1 Tax=Ichthyophthirius multifiliis TaxID=5932 RepID=G0QP31_ICHMU|nr:hypothetical protein IMG5_063590 [Ichthyophthirius multifiliis]EGR33018.1 hypothetical protein IMG5_063590 [Ichthyophthirius multifiliis]|eukprot:XP_004037004.1 hypothetical protein IMG5_063590 [Ichthyophthirius multifiliis]
MGNLQKQLKIISVKVQQHTVQCVIFYKQKTDIMVIFYSIETDISYILILGIFYLMHLEKEQGLKIKFHLNYYPNIQKYQEVQIRIILKVFVNIFLKDLWLLEKIKIKFLFQQKCFIVVMAHLFLASKKENQQQRNLRKDSILLEWRMMENIIFIHKIQLIKVQIIGEQDGMINGSIFAREYFIEKKQQLQQYIINIQLQKQKIINIQFFFVQKQINDILNIQQARKINSFIQNSISRRRWSRQNTYNKSLCKRLYTTNNSSHHRG